MLIRPQLLQATKRYKQLKPKIMYKKYEPNAE